MRKPDTTLRTELTEALRRCAQLQAENDRLKALLRQHGIAVPSTAGTDNPMLPQVVPPADVTAPASLSTGEKITLFRRLFRGRTDVYPRRWEGRNGKSGYAPACANEWRAEVCAKPRIKCADCAQRVLLPVTDQVIYDHLAGQHTLGVYPLLPDDTCHLLAVDFDEADWQADARAFVQSCRALDVPVALEISRSGNGAHAWIFFAEAVPARAARRLGTALISHTCAKTRQLTLASYDRLFPNQDTLPKGGFGNLIALPLQKKPREAGHSVFVDDDFIPYTDQWAFLTALERLPPEAIEPAILHSTGGGHPLDVAFIAEEDQLVPWQRPAAPPRQIPGPLPTQLAVTVANQLYFEKAALSAPLANRLIRLAAFQNPEFYRAQALRLPVWDKPRVIGCAENYPQHIALPRGCLDAVHALLAENGIEIDVHDERYLGCPIDAAFTGTLRPDQEAAADAMLAHETGVLCAPTAFGKTVTAAALIARRSVNTLVLVHRTELLKQWQERLSAFLNLPREAIGVIGGGRHRPTGRIDIAVMQSLSRKGAVDARVEDYGHLVVDECHHLSAVSFEALLKRAKGRYVLGLTATPVRRDGQHPILFMQCGPIRHTAARPDSAPAQMAVYPRMLPTRLALPAEAAIQEVFRQLAAHEGRNQHITADIRAAYHEGRRLIVLTERIEHLDALAAALQSEIEHLFLLHGRLSKKLRRAVLAELEAMDDVTPRVLLATGRLVGEGFDHPPLDTLVLAMPISWKGTLQQYAGRLHRAHATKADVRIYDYVDTEYPPLRRMWEKRQRGYRAMGYRVVVEGTAMA